ncbi:helix-turn-helix domain-containing protein [Cupriavidus basilensis]
MQRNRKSVQETQELAGALRRRRRELGLTLSRLAGTLGIDVGQLSRFERGEFKFVSKNLQKVAEYLQVAADGRPESDAAVKQFAELLGRSERHKAAAIALVRALQDLQ